MSSIVIAGDTSGSVTLQAPAVAGSTILTLPSTTGTIALTSGITPGGSTTQVQYNNAGAFGGITGATTNGTALTLVAPVLGTPASGVLTSCTGLNYDGFKNRFINGDMRIDQRNANASINLGTSTFSADRWVGYNNDSTGVIASQVVTDAPTNSGFVNSVRLTVSTAIPSYSTAVACFFRQTIEGNNIADFMWGTASAKSFTLSFWVKSSVTGTFGGTANSGDSNRTYGFTYVISAANTWEQKTINIAGDTSGTWYTDNRGGLILNFGLGVGTNRTVSTTGAWVNQFLGWQPTGTIQWASNVGATWNITGVQLEKGSTATSFDVRSIGTELALCQRYCTTINDATTSGYIQGYGGGCRGTTYIGVTIPLPVAMRSTPSLSNVGGTVRLTVAGSKVDSASSSMTIGGVTPTIGYSANSGNLAITYIGGPVTGLTGIANDVCVTFFTNGDGKLFALSEL